MPTDHSSLNKMMATWWASFHTLSETSIFILFFFYFIVWLCTVHFFVNVGKDLRWDNIY